MQICIALSDNEFGALSLNLDELETECQRLQKCYDALETAPYGITVRSVRKNEVTGTYIVTHNGNLQILGHSVDIDDACPGLSGISERAWNLYCKG